MIMISVECPHCKTEVQANTAFAGSSMDCPVCHKQFVVPESSCEKRDVKPTTRKQNLSIDQKQKKVSVRLKDFIIFLLMTGFVVFILFFFTRGGIRYNSGDGGEQDKKISQVMIENRLKKLLKEPDNADFRPGMSINEIEYMGNACYKVDGIVFFRNSYGGYTKLYYWAILKKRDFEIIGSNLYGK